MTNVDIKNSTNLEKIKKKQKIKKDMSVSNNFVNKSKHIMESGTENKECKMKKNKKKRSKSTSKNVEAPIEEPARKIQKKNLKSEIIGKSLKNLNFGDNSHTLTNVTDNMNVVGEKKKLGKVIQSKSTSNVNDGSGDVKEKVKWNKKKWNKGRKDFTCDKKLLATVIVGNLPLRLVLSYKKILTDHLSVCGQIKHIGVAELYPLHNPKPVFSTSVLFDSEEAAAKALEEHNSLIEGNRVDMKRAALATESTIIVKSFTEITEQTLSTIFSSAGRIRKIHQMSKAKRGSSTAFVEFHSSEEVDRALKIVEGVKIKGKKIHVFKYQNKNVEIKANNTCTVNNG